MIRKLALVVALLLTGPLGVGAALAQAFPARPVTMIVPFAAGGPTDALARILARSMSDALRQTVVVENVPGAGGATGAQRLIRSAADGYTILISDLTLPAAPLLNANVKYDLSRDFTTLGVVNAGPMVLISRAGLAPDAARLFGVIRDQGNRINLGHSGIGSNSYICGLLLQQALGLQVTEVPYRGAGPAMTDMLAGTLDIMCEQSTTAIPQIEGGTVMAHGVTSAVRLEALPSVPPLSEAGLAGFDFTVWHGLYGPPGTPPHNVQVLNGALRAALADPATSDLYKKAGRTEFPERQQSPEAHFEMLRKEQERLRLTLERAGLKSPN